MVGLRPEASHSIAAARHCFHEEIGRASAKINRQVNPAYEIKKKINPELEVEGIVLTMYESRRKLSKEVAEEVKKHFKDKVYPVMIPRNVRLSEAPSHGLPIVVYDKNSIGTKSYNDLARLVLKANTIKDKK